MKRNNKNIIILIILEIILGIIIFSVLFLTNNISYGRMVQLYENTDQFTIYSNRILDLDEDDIIRQEFICNENNLYAFALKYQKEEFSKGVKYYVSIGEVDTGKVLEEWIEDGKEIGSDGFREYRLKPMLENTSGKNLYIEVRCNKLNQALAGSEADSLHGGKLYINGEEQTGDIIIKLYTEKYVISTLIWAISFSFCAAGLVLAFAYYKAWKKLRQSFVIIRRMFVNNFRQYSIWLIWVIVVGILGIIIEKLLSQYSVLPYNTVGSFNEYRFFFITVFILVMSVIIMFRNKFEEEPEKPFLLVFALVGALFVIVMPAEAEISWDESIHYWNAVGVSHAFRGTANNAESWLYWRSGIGYGLPNSISDLRIMQSHIQELYDTGIMVSGNTNILSRMAAISYIPSGIAIALGRMLNLPYFLIFHFGAGMNMIVYIVTIYIAMKRLKAGKMILVVVAGTVTSVFLASVYSYDSWVTCFTILGMSYFLAVMQEKENVKKKDLIVMLIAFSLAFTPKAVYFPLFLIYLMIPKDKFSSKEQCLKFRTTCLALCATFALEMFLPFKWFVLILVIVWGVLYGIIKLLLKLSWKARVMLIIVGVILLGIIGMLMLYRIVPTILGRGDLRGGDEVNSAEQVIFILNNPFSYGKILLRYLKNNYLAFSGALQVPFKMFGYIGESTYYAVSFVLLWIVAFTDKRQEDLWKNYNRVKVAVCILCGMIIVLIATALYISFTPVAADTVNGCQPRYMIPLLFPFFGMIGSNKIRNEMSIKTYNGIVLTLVALILLLNVWQVVISLYS